MRPTVFGTSVDREKHHTMIVDKSGATLVTLPPSEALLVPFLSVGRPPQQLTRLRGFLQKTLPPPQQICPQGVTAANDCLRKETRRNLDLTVFCVLVNSQKKCASEGNHESSWAWEMFQLAHRPAQGSDEHFGLATIIALFFAFEAKLTETFGSKPASLLRWRTQALLGTQSEVTR